MITDWLAPVALKPVQGLVELPGSKSLTNRELVLAALAQGESRLRAALRARDTDLMIAALQQLGAGIEVADTDIRLWRPLPTTTDSPLSLPSAHTQVACGLAGTVMRFLPPLAALQGRRVVFSADEEALSRPITPLFDALGQLGVKIEPLCPPQVFPFAVTGPARVPGSDFTIDIDSSSSSQFLSAMAIFAASLTTGSTCVRVRSQQPVPSVTHLEMTWDCLRRRGIDVKHRDLPHGGVEVALSGGPLRAADITIEPDLSNAGPFLVAAAVTAGRVGVRRWPLRTTQAGDRWRQLLSAFGARVYFDPVPEGEDCATLWVEGASTPGEGFDLDLSATGELVPTLAALAAHASSPSHLRGIGHLRGHETDRLQALETELRRCGVWAEADEDSLFIDPAKTVPAPGPDSTQRLMQTYRDHRMATFAAIMGLTRPGTRVHDVATTAKTLPQFSQLWDRLVTGSDGVVGNSFEGENGSS
ncbi:MAG: 3-phosphoshikimate 1-carboxyvinyltransferase [Actinomycetaceae bacterium]|nr:3-phosphoshikimate 1-carboxyvinyltransferase [Actinomycetaceae bacterium]